MTNRLLTFLVLLMTLGAPHPALAADCGVTPELIFRLKTPEYPSNAVWDTVYGEPETREQYTTGLILESGNVLAAGERVAEGSDDVELIVTEIEEHGRVLWEDAHKIPGLRSVRAMRRRKGGYLVLGEKKATQSAPEIWLGFFDDSGKQVSTKSIRQSSALIPQDIIPARSGGGYLLAAASAGKDGVYNSVLYKLNAKGDVISRRAFSPGLENRILHLTPAGKDFYMGAGYMNGDSGRETGWLVLLNKDGEIVWQRQYPRGRESRLTLSADFDAETLIAAGESRPSDGGTQAGWVMRVNHNNGDILWQRYYTGDLNYTVRDLLKSGESIISLVLDGMRPEKSAAQQAIRLLTLNPRGDIIASGQFLNAEGAHATQMLLGKTGERIIVGSTDIAPMTRKTVMGPPPPGAKPEESAAPPTGLDAWAIAAPAAAPYEDPCAMVSP